MIFLSELSVRKGRALYTVSLRPYHGERVSMQTDGNLGQIMTGLAVLFDAIQVLQQGGTMPNRAPLRGTVELTTFWIEPLTVWPYRWQLTMAAAHRPSEYVCKLDQSLEAVMMGFGKAMEYFARKDGLIVAYDGVMRNRDRAGELGLLTKEDVHGST